jgi:hypothetical protein
MMSRTRKGPTVKRVYCDPLTGRSMWGQSKFSARPVAYRDVEYGGRGRIRVLRTVYVDELGEDATEWLAPVKAAIMRCVALLGLVDHEQAREVVREVMRKVVVYRIPEKFKQRMAELTKAARKWARHEANKGKRRGRDIYVKARTTHDAGTLQERWDRDEFTVRRRHVVDEGNAKEGW